MNGDQGLARLFGPYSSCATIIPIIREKKDILDNLWTF